MFAILFLFLNDFFGSVVFSLKFMLLPANFHTPGILFTMTSRKRKKDLRHKNVSRIQRPLHRDAIIYTYLLFQLEPPSDNAPVSKCSRQTCARIFPDD